MGWLRDFFTWPEPGPVLRADHPVYGIHPRGMRTLATLQLPTNEWDLLVDHNGKYLRIDRVQRGYMLFSEDLALLVAYCGEPVTAASELSKAPTISCDIALKTIEFLKETI